MRIKKVFVCSPYKGNYFKRKSNIKKAKEYCQNIASYGMIPIAPHLYFTQFLNDKSLKQRTLGLAMGLELLKQCNYIYVYGKPTAGMEIEIKSAKKYGIPIIEKGV